MKLITMIKATEAYINGNKIPMYKLNNYTLASNPIQMFNGTTRIRIETDFPYNIIEESELPFEYNALLRSAIHYAEQHKLKNFVPLVCKRDEHIGVSCIFNLDTFKFNTLIELSNSNMTESLNAIKEIRR